MRRRVTGAPTNEHGVPEGATVHLSRSMGGCNKRPQPVRYEIPATETGRVRSPEVNCTDCLTPIVTPGYELPPTLLWIECVDGQLVDFGLRSTADAH